MDGRNALFGRSGGSGRPRPEDYNRVQPPPSQGQYGQRPPPPGERSMPSRRPAPGGYDGGSYQQGPPSVELVFAQIKETQSKQHTLRNMCLVSSRDFPNQVGRPFYLKIDNGRQLFDVFSAAIDDANVQPGTFSLGMYQRKRLAIDGSRPVRCQVFHDYTAPILEIEVTACWSLKNKATDQYQDSAVMAQEFIDQFPHHIFMPGQQLMMEWPPRSEWRLDLAVTKIQTLDKSGQPHPMTSDQAARGQMTKDTQVTITPVPKAGVPMPLKLKGGSKRAAPATAIIRPDFKFTDMGIGGLDDEFSTIFRRAFASRVFPSDLVEKMGIQHVKGMLLHGPPGTGKTLIARQISNMLNAKDIQIINGPDFVSKFVGESEKNLRDKFAPAVKAQKENADGLYVVIFDELDAVCKQRGSSGGGTGVGDSIVNTLLTLLDGVDQLNNLLLIGMTNRKDMIDEALLRPGRLELHLEISLPDEAGRVQILNIHTSKIRDLNKLADDVDIKELAKMTKNYSGAELTGLIRAALSFAFTRHTSIGGVAGVEGNPEDVMLTRDDLLHALNDVKPAYGVSEEELDKASPYGIIHYSPNTELILSRGFAEIRALSNPGPPYLSSILIHGPSGSGKTALAAEIGRKSEIPFVKLVRPIDVGTSEPAKLEYLRRTFADAYKSDLSMIILDDIEDIIEYNPIGPRFSNAVVQYLGALLRTNPPANRKLLIISTASDRDMLRSHRALRFQREIHVPAVQDMNELSQLLTASGHIPDRGDVDKACHALREKIQGEYLGLGIKTIFSALQIALVTSDHTPLPDVLASEIKDAMVDNGVAHNYDSY